VAGFVGHRRVDAGGQGRRREGDRRHRQNLFFAFFYNAAGVPVAAGVLYPFMGLLLSPVIAALATSLSSVSVISNALRLRGRGSANRVAAGWVERSETHHGPRRALVRISSTNAVLASV
jgi:hypothetical protein